MFINNERYVISTNNIVEVIPYINSKSIPNMPTYVVGLIDYHGSAIPVIDICLLLLGRKSKKQLSTRIIISSVNVNGTDVKLGLLAEKSTEILSIDEELFHPPSMGDPDVPVVGDVAILNGKILTRVSIDMLTREIESKYFISSSVEKSFI